jgi:hypothetical protein
MALPFILSLLGSGLAGAGALGTGLLASPLIAGAVGSGLGAAIQSKDLGEGIKTGLMSGLLGGIGGALVGGAGGEAARAGVLSAPAEGAATGLRGALARMPSGFTAPAQSASAAMNAARATGTAPALAFRDIARQGLNQGVLTGAGIGTALPGFMQAMQPQPMMVPEPRDIPEAEPMRRDRRTPPAGYRPGIDPEFEYFSPAIYSSRRMAGGGMIAYQPVGMSQPVYMQAGGIASMMPGAMMMEDDMSEIEGMEEEDSAEDYAEDLREMNDKDIVRAAVSAIRGEIAEDQAAIVLGMFLQQFGEEALRRLVSDVRSGKVDGERGDIEGMVEGPGDGMDDLVPAEMDDGSQDVLLSDGEFIVPADVVSGLGNGSTDAGAEELYNMMDRVREERTGMREQPAQVKVGGLLPA